MLKFYYMNKSIKQIYASLELCENDLKILVAEYFNTRFNVLKVDRKVTKAISDFKIVDKELLKNDIKALVNDCSTKLGAKIEQVLLVLPAYNFKRFPLRSTVIAEDGILTKKDIARAISNSLRASVDSDVMVVNPMILKYTINGISTRRMPDKEACAECVVDIDLLCADKEMAYDYVSVVEESGVKVLDIALNNYSIGKEASIFEESYKQNVICLDINKTCTYLSLFSKGRLLTTEVVFDGLNSIINQLKFKYDIPDSDITKLIKYDLNFNSAYDDDIVYAYNVNNETKTISYKELNDSCLNPLNNLVDKLVAMCKPIIEQGAVMFITGEGQQMSTLVDKIKDLSNCEVKSYCPETIGVRDPALTALVGCLVAYKEKAMLNNLNVTCIDLLEYESKIDQKEIDTEGETITTRIKNLFKQYIEKEEE